MKVTDILKKWFVGKLEIIHSWENFWTIDIDEPIKQDIELSYLVMELLKTQMKWINNKEIQNDDMIDRFLNRDLFEKEDIENILGAEFSIKANAKTSRSETVDKDPSTVLHPRKKKKEEK